MNCINISTGGKIIEIKKFRNEHLINLLNVENEILDREIYLRSCLKIYNINKIKLLEEINKIEGDQTDEYTLEREEKVKYLTNFINSVSMDFSKINKELKELYERCKKIIQGISYLNKKIPDKSLITNYKFVLKDEVAPKKIDN